MQLLSKAISDILLGDSDITGITGTGNIWHAKIPQQTTSGSTEPQSISIYFYTYAVTPNDTKSGRSDLDTHMVRVHISGTDDHQMNQVARYVRFALDRIEPGLYSDVEIQGSRFLNSYFEPEGNYQLELQEWRLEFQFRVIDDTIRDGGTVPTVLSGTYTPTLSNQADISSVSVLQCQYMKVGSTVTASGVFNMTVTSGLAAGSFQMTLPIASNIGAIEDLAGVCSAGDNIAYTGQIIGNVANNTAQVTAIGPGDFVDLNYAFTFTYQII